MTPKELNELSNRTDKICIYFLVVIPILAIAIILSFFGIKSLADYLILIGVLSVFAGAIYHISTIGKFVNLVVGN